MISASSVKMSDITADNIITSENNEPHNSCITTVILLNELYLTGKKMVWCKSRQTVTVTLENESVCFFAYEKSRFSPNMAQIHVHQMSLVMRKPGFCICENKDADQLRGNREADQRLCFRYLDSPIPLLPKSESLSF